MGANAGDKAAAIDNEKVKAPEKDPYQKNEEYIGLNTSIKNLIRSLDNFAIKQQFKPPVPNQQNNQQNPFNTNIADAIKNSVSSIPGMNKIIPQIGTLAKTFDIIMKALGIGAAAKGVIGAAANGIKGWGVTDGTSSGFGQSGNKSSGFGQSGNKSVGFTGAVLTQGLSNQLGFKDVFQHLKDAGRSFYKSMLATPPNADNFKVSGYDTPLSKTMSNAGRGNNLQQGLSSISKFFSTSGSVLAQQMSKLTPAVIGSLLVAPALVAVGMIAVGVGLIKFAKSLVEADRAISIYNPATAVAWTLKDITDMILDMTSAKKREPSQKDFLATWTEFNVDIRPILDSIIITFTELGTQLLKVCQSLIEIWNMMPDWLKKATAKALIFSNPITGLPAMSKELLDIEKRNSERREQKQVDYSNEFRNVEYFIRKKDEAGYLTALAEYDNKLEELKSNYNKVFSVACSNFMADTGSMSDIATSKNQIENFKDGRELLLRLKNQLKNEEPSVISNEPSKLDESSNDMIRQMKALEKALDALYEEYKKTNANAEIIDVGNFMAGVVNDPMVYNPGRDRAFDYTKDWDPFAGKKTK